jgi:hypothetical protein
VTAMTYTQLRCDAELEEETSAQQAGFNGSKE